MKTHNLVLAITIFGLAPSIAIAQGTYLSAPDGNPTNALVVANGGNIGIGTANPITKLDLRNGSVRVSIDPEDDTIPGLVSYALAGRASQGQEIAWQIFTAPVGGGFGVRPNSLSIWDYPNAAERFTILPSLSQQAAPPVLIDGLGNVGFGTHTPLARVDVQGWIKIHDSGPPIPGRYGLELGVHSSSAPGCSWIQSFESRPLVLNPLENNVGIGTFEPQTKLDVAGKVRCEVLELTSDRNVKAEIEPVDKQQILQNLCELPIASWCFTNAPTVRHIGPMAQDFQAAFNLGSDDKHIATVDADGVALAAIQALNEKVELLMVRVTTLEEENAYLRSREETAAIRNNPLTLLAELPCKD